MSAYEAVRRAGAMVLPALHRRGVAGAALVVASLRALMRLILLRARLYTEKMRGLSD